MLKPVLSLVLILCTTLVGNYFSLKLSSRRETVEGLLQGVTRLKTQICFGGIDIFTAVSECFGADIIRNLPHDGESISEYWSRQVDLIPKSSGLNKDDRKIIRDFGQNLGVTDIEGQINNCELYLRLFEDMLNNSKELEKTRSRLYRILGFSCGAVVTLVVL